MYACGSEDTLWESVLLPSSETWGLNSVVRHSSECLQPLGHLAGPVPSFQHLLSGDGLLLNTARGRGQGQPQERIKMLPEARQKGAGEPIAASAGSPALLPVAESPAPHCRKPFIHGNLPATSLGPQKW